MLQRFKGSYGVRTTIMDMFAPREVTQAQILSKEFYYKRVSEVQTRIRKLERPFLFYFETKASDYSD